MRRRARMRERFSRAGKRGLTAMALAALLVQPAGPARAGEESAGTRAAAFLSSGNGPALLGMGGAAIGGGTGLQASAWNVAALAHHGALEGVFSHATLAAAGQRDWAAVAGRLNAGQLRWAASATFQDEGTIVGRDAHDQPTGDVNATSLALGLQLARPVGERLSVGAGTRVVSQAIGDSRGSALAFDAGAQARFGMVSLGVSGRDFGGGMRWEGQSWRMPASLGAGVALNHEASGLLVALDLVAPSNYYRSVRIGAQWRWNDRFALRGGYRAELGAEAGEPLSGPAFGVGARAGMAWVDYALVVSGDGSSSHRFALALRGAAHSPGAEASAVIGPQPKPER